MALCTVTTDVECGVDTTLQALIADPAYVVYDVGNELDFFFNHLDDEDDGYFDDAIDHIFGHHGRQLNLWTPR